MRRLALALAAPVLGYCLGAAGILALINLTGG